MSSYIEKDDFLVLSKEEGFPKVLDIEKHKISPIDFETIRDQVFEFKNVNKILYFSSEPVNIPFGEVKDNNYIFWGQISLLELKHNYVNNTSSGKFKITMLFPYERIKKPEQGKGVLTVGVVVLKEGKVLLVKHNKHSQHENDVYGIPAGRLNEDEGITAAAAREVKEETGIDVKEKDLKRLSNVSYAEILRKTGETKTFVIIPFFAESFSGELNMGHEDIETTPEWVDVNSLDKVNMLPNLSDIVREAVEKSSDN